MQKNIVDYFVHSPPSFHELSSSLNLLAQDDTCLCFVEENGKFIFSSCCVDFLFYRRHDALLSIVYEFATAFHEKHRCSVKTMLSMFYLWFRHVNALLRKGSHVTLLLELFQKVFDRLSSYAETLTIDIAKGEARVPVPRRLRYSRNLNAETNSTVRSGEGRGKWNAIVSGLCRHQVHLASTLETIFSDTDDSSTPADSVDVHVLAVTSTVSSIRRSFAEQGFVVQVDDSSLLKLRQRHSIRLVLVRGRLHSRHKHIGLNQSFNEMHISSHAKMAEPHGRQDDESILRRLQSFSVNVIVSTEPLDDALRLLLEEHSIVVVQPGSESGCFDAIRILEKRLNMAAIEYGLDIGEESVSKEVPIELVDVGFQSEMHFVRLRIPTTFTVILCHPVAAYHAYLEDRFSHCLERVRNALRVRKVLPGQGQSEQSLVDFLADDARWTDLVSTPYFSQIRHVFADSFQSYVRYCNRHGGASSAPFYDDLSSKLAAWKTAASAVAVIGRIRCQVSSVRAEDCPDGLNLKSWF